jgi:hypothetical protein
MDRKSLVSKPKHQGFEVIKEAALEEEDGTTLQSMKTLDLMASIESEGRLPEVPI